MTNPGGELVTVVVPTFNEERHIRDCLDSLRRQDHDAIRLLVVDGMSTDRTRAIAEAVATIDPRVSVIDNPRRTAAAAMNVALEQCQTRLLVRADAHAVYAPDFVRRNLEVRAETGAANVGGPMVPIGTTAFGRAVAAVTSSRLGMGTGAFHWTDRRRVVDTVYLGCYEAAQLRDLGGYDEDRLQYAAEDQELNMRLRDAGGTIVCDPSIRSWYFPRERPSDLWRQYRNYGVCKASTLAKHRRLPTVRAIVPAAMVSGSGLGVVTALATRRVRYLLPLGLWVGFALGATQRLNRRPGADPARVLVALSLCHWGHGIGFLVGLSRAAAGRGFERRPARR